MKKRQLDDYVTVSCTLGSNYSASAEKPNRKNVLLEKSNDFRKLSKFSMVIFCR